MKNDVRPIYFELQGYLSQAPQREMGAIFDERVWNQHNETIKELEAVTGKTYDKYKITPERWGDKLRVTVQVYRTILGGLISRLHGEYFPDELSPIK